MTKKEKKKESNKEKSEKKKTFSNTEFLTEELNLRQKEASEFKDKYYRALADMENMRKRLASEKLEMIAFARDNIIKDFLTPLDQLQKALSFTDNLSDEMKNWAQGFKMISSQFVQVLEQNDVRPFESMGHKFDPHLHEAITTEESDKEDGTILEVIQTGYKHEDKILRVAQVKVAKSAADKELKENTIEGEKL
jgi:molecular chaperone GrpE